MIAELARAKINLTLHVGRLIENEHHKHAGYHLVDSLVVFADYGDRIMSRPAPSTQLRVFGPFSEGLTVGSDNLVLKALKAVESVAQVPIPNFDIEIEKNLPVASGIGGGSANAAAMLRILRHYVELSETQWLDIAKGLGADVPVCFFSRTARMRGIGEDIELRPNLGRVAALLVNPGFPVSTAQIFQTFDAKYTEAETLPKGNNSSGTLLQQALYGRNDLEPVAIDVASTINEVVTNLYGQIGCKLARMSGSGATCVGVFSKLEKAQSAAKKLSKAHPEWWVQCVWLGDDA